MHIIFAGTSSEIHRDPFVLDFHHMRLSIGKHRSETRSNSPSRMQKNRAKSEK